MPPDFPPTGFQSAHLELTDIPVGGVWQRIYFSRYTDPLGYGTNLSRFSDSPTAAAAPRFGVIYFGASLMVCFLEAVLRDQTNGRLETFPISKSELEQRVRTTYEVTTALKVVNLCNDAPSRIGVHTDAIRASDHTLGQISSGALWSHNSQPDGLLYPSRFNEERNLVLYDRARAKLTPGITTRLIDCGAEMDAIIDGLQLAIIGMP